MTCTSPLHAWLLKEPYRTPASNVLVFAETVGRPDRYDRIRVSCGACLSCRIARSRSWAIRCMHEAQMHDSSCFLTLTFKDEYLPPRGGLEYRDFQLFLKRVRKKFGAGIRFFHSGEYGDGEGKREWHPHHHAILFGLDFVQIDPEARVVYRNPKTGDLSYQSRILDELWSKDGENMGLASVGSTSWQSAAYVARYNLKKINGEKAKEHYDGRRPEFMTCSNGIGRDWLLRYHSDVYPRDQVVMNGKEYPVPRYYDRVMLDLIENHGFVPDFDWSEMITARKERGILYNPEEELHPDRLDVKAKVVEDRVNRLPRSLKR